MVKYIEKDYFYKMVKTLRIEFIFQIFLQTLLVLNIFGQTPTTSHPLEMPQKACWKLETEKINFIASDNVKLKLFLFLNSGRVIEVNAKDGTQTWIADFGNKTFSKPFVADNKIFSQI